MLNCFFRIFLFLLSVNLFAGNIPYLMPVLSRVFGILAVGFWSGFYLPFDLKKSPRPYVSVLCLVLSCVFFLTGFGALLGTGLLIYTLMQPRTRDHAKELQLFLSTLLLYTVFYYVDMFCPYVFQVLQAVSLNYSIVFTPFSGIPSTLGASAIGVKITLSALCLSLSYAHHRKKVSFLLLSLAAPLLANAIWLSLQKPMATFIHFFLPTREILPYDTQMVLLLVTVAWVLPLHRLVNMDDLEEGMASETRRIPLIFVIVMTALAFGGLGVYKGSPLRKSTILFCDKGTDFRVPVHGKVYGKNSPGMFGILPQYLRMRGMNTLIVKESLTEEMLEGADVIVVFNPAAYFKGAERVLVNRFVEKGGGLLVAGDHTDVNGVMGPINNLLQPFDIQLNFDTALPLKTGWVNSLDTWFHPVTSVLEKDYDAGIWVGASLDVNFPAIPLISGRFGWADTGNYLNTKRAYLGDYKRSKDEQLGDVVLVAERSFKKGRVIVFGDTSTFQNGIIPETAPFIDSIFDRLMTGDSFIFHMPFQAAFSMICLAALFLVLSRNYQSVFFLLILFTLHGVVLIKTVFMERSVVYRGIVSSSFYQPALIDISHMPRFDPLASSDNSVWGITLNMMRTRMIPLFLKNLDTTRLQEGQILFVISPVMPYTEKEIRLLKNYMTNGGRIVWSVGWEDVAGSVSFLNAFGLDLDSVPLGSSEVKLEKMTVQFVEAWPIIFNIEETKVLIKKWGFPIITYHPVGKGGLLLIGDSEFLLSGNIESYKTYNLHHIRFFNYVMKYLAGDLPLSVFKEIPDNEEQQQ